MGVGISLMSTEEMSRREIDTFLESVGVGVLALTDGAEAYAIPESFGYDGEDVYFQFVHHEDSHKMRLIETTETATFTVYAENVARSVLVRGTLEPVPVENELQATNAIAENATIPTLNVDPTLSLEKLSFDFYRLVPAELSGRTFGVDAASGCVSS